jgi:hypothetical protein
VRWGCPIVALAKPVNHKLLDAENNWWQANNASMPVTISCLRLNAPFEAI